MYWAPSVSSLDAREFSMELIDERCEDGRLSAELD
jgi:hypothetical protein